MWFVAVTSATLGVLTGAIFMMTAATQGSARAHAVLAAVIPWMPRSIGLMMMATMHCRDVMMFAIVMRNIAIGQPEVWLPDNHDDYLGRAGSVGSVGNKQVHAGDAVDGLLNAIVNAQEARHAAVCPICLDNVQGVHLLVGPHGTSKVRLQIMPCRVVVCRVCRQATHVTCLLRYLLQWNCPQKCPMCNSALYGHAITGS